jgi:hypothetical protein
MTQNIDEPLSELRSSTTNYYSQDGAGIVTSLITSAGALGNTYTYDSFGNLTGGDQRPRCIAPKNPNACVPCST